MSRCAALFVAFALSCGGADVARAQTITFERDVVGIAPSDFDSWGTGDTVALDMYEHSYHIDYGAKAATYVDTFMDAIRSSNADKLFTDGEVIGHASANAWRARRAYAPGLSRALALLTFLGTTALATAEDGFRKLRQTQISTHLAGNEVSDGVHWAEQ